MVKTNSDSLVLLSRATLDARLRTILTKRAGISEGEADDALFVAVVDEAAKALHIDPDLTPAQKADGVYERFQERMLSSVQKELRKESPEDARRTAEAVDDRIRELSDDQRTQIQSV